ncbi:hypothetical protein [Nostoc sp.]
MKAANQYIFTSFISFVKKANVYDIPNYEEEKPQYIKTEPIEKEWLKTLIIENIQPILPNFITAYITFKESNFFVVIGWLESVKFDETITIYPLNAGLITALLFELKVPIRQNAEPYEILDEILFQNKDSKYSGHDYTDVIKYFEKISVYEILESSPIQKDKLEKLSGFYITKNSNNLFLNFSHETIAIFETIFVEGSDSIPYDNLLLSITSISWKHSFLDIYRCIEKIFPLAKLDELCRKLSISTPLIHLAGEMEKSLGWKPKEEDALKNIIDNSPLEAKQLFREVKQFLDGSEDGKLEKFVYQVRNCIVHYRPATQVLEISKLDAVNWDKLIRGALLVVKHWYKEYNISLN